MKFPKIVKEVQPAEMIPAWYGVAWMQFDRDVAICLPMPFNLLAAAGRSIVIWMRYGYRIVHRNSRDAYAQGLRDGKRSKS